MKSNTYTDEARFTVQVGSEIGSNIQARNATMREDGGKLRVLHRIHLLLRLDQTRPHGLIQHNHFCLSRELVVL